MRDDLTDALRRRQQTRDISEELELATADSTRSTIERDEMGRALATLSPDQQVVIALRYYKDLPLEEIAARLGVPSGTVQSRIHYALKKLHAAIAAAEEIA